MLTISALLLSGVVLASCPTPPSAVVPPLLQIQFPNAGICSASHGPQQHAVGEPYCIQWEPVDVRIGLGPVENILKIESGGKVAVREVSNSYTGPVVDCCGVPAPCGPQPIPFAESFEVGSEWEAKACLEVTLGAGFEIKATSGDLIELLLAKLEVGVNGSLEVSGEACFGYKYHEITIQHVGTSHTPIMVPCGWKMTLLQQRKTATQDAGYIISYVASAGQTNFAVESDFCVLGKVEGKGNSGSYFGIETEWTDLRPIDECTSVCH